MEKNLNSCVKFLENNGQLVRVQERLSPYYEVAAALRYLEQKSGKAVLFEKIQGYEERGCPEAYQEPDPDRKEGEDGGFRDR